MTIEVGALVAALVAFATAVAAVADARRQVASVQREQDRQGKKLEDLERVKASRAETDRLDREKASRELVDGFRADLQKLEVHIDRRFDEVRELVRLMREDTNPGR